MKALCHVVVAAMVLTATGCASLQRLQYGTEPSHLRSPGYPLSYPAYEVIISTEGDPVATRGQVNCYDDAGCMERLFASTRHYPESVAQLFMSPPDGSSLSVEYGPSGHGVTAVGWGADALRGNSEAVAGRPNRWQLRSLTDPSAATLRLRIRVPVILGLPAVPQSDRVETGDNHDVGNANPGLSYRASFDARAKGVIRVAEFVERAREAHQRSERFPWFPATACRTATITLIAKGTNGNPENVAEVSLPVPDVGHVLPVPFRRGSTIRLHPACGVESLN